MFLTTAREAKQEEESGRTAEKRQQQAQDQGDDEAVLGAVDRLTAEHKAATREQVKTEARISRERVDRAFTRLKAAGVLKEGTASVPIGNGGQRQAKCVRRVED